MATFVLVLLLVALVAWFLHRNKRKRVELKDDEVALKAFLMREDPVSRIQVAAILSTATALATKLVGVMNQ